MYSVKQVAERFGVNQHAILGWIAAGELVAVNVARNAGGQRPRWRISESALAEFELRRTKTPPLPRAPRRKRAAEIVQYYK
jgi:transposase